MQRDSIANTFIVAIGVCLFCSLLVSGAAVGSALPAVGDEAIASQEERAPDVSARLGLAPRDPTVRNEARRIDKLEAERVDRLAGR